MIHQSRQLHKYHDGKLDLEIDTVGTEGFYDDKRLRCHGEALYRAYEILYPRDSRSITPELLTVVGHRGVASLWCDRGRVRGQRLEMVCVTNKSMGAETRLIHDWLRELGYRPDGRRGQINGNLIRFSGAEADDFISKIRPLIPRHRHHTLRR